VGAPPPLAASIFTLSDEFEVPVAHGRDLGPVDTARHGLARSLDAVVGAEIVVHTAQATPSFADEQEVPHRRVLHVMGVEFVLGGSRGMASRTAGSRPRRETW
jgi:hypothetical protein